MKRVGSEKRDDGNTANSDRCSSQSQCCYSNSIYWEKRSLDTSCKKIWNFFENEPILITPQTEKFINL